MNIMILVLGIIILIVTRPLQKKRAKRQEERIEHAFREAEEAGIEGLREEFEQNKARLRVPFRLVAIGIVLIGASLGNNNTQITMILLIIAIPLFMIGIVTIGRVRSEVMVRRREVRQILTTHKTKK